MSTPEKYTALLNHALKVVHLQKVWRGRGYLTHDEKAELRASEAAIDRMNREHESNKVKQGSLL